MLCRLEYCVPSSFLHPYRRFFNISRCSPYNLHLPHSNNPLIFFYVFVFIFCSSNANTDDVTLGSVLHFNLPDVFFTIQLWYFCLFVFYSFVFVFFVAFFKLLLCQTLLFIPFCPSFRIFFSFSSFFTFSLTFSASNYTSFIKWYSDFYFFRFFFWFLLQWYLFFTSFISPCYLIHSFVAAAM